MNTFPFQNPFETERTALYRDSNRERIADGLTITTAAVAVFTLLFSLYALSYSGTFTADDEQHLAAGAQTLAVTGQLGAMQLYGNPRLQGGFHEVDPALSVLGSLVYRWISGTRLGAVQALFWLTPICTALTGVFVFLLGARQGYDLPLCAYAALAFGAATFAWAYAKTFFRDPLAMLFVAGALLCFEITITKRGALWIQLLHWGLLMVLTVGGVLTKNIVALVVPVFAITALSRSRTDSDHRPSRSKLVAGIAIFTAVCIAFLARPRTDYLFRSSGDYISWLVEWLRVIPHDGFWSAVAGALISPGKGIIFYAPPLVLAGLGWLLDWRKAWPQLLAPTLLLGAFVIAQSLVYDYRWTNPQWGARYLLPTLPGLAVAILPAANWLRQHWPRGVWWILGAVLGAGVITQISGVLIAPPVYSAQVNRIDPAAFFGLAIWDPYYSAIAGHWRLILSGTPWSLAWVRLFPINPVSVVILVAGLLAALVLSAVFLRLACIGCLSIRTTLGAFGLALLSVLAIPYVLLTVYRSDPAYFADRTEFASAVDLLNKSVGPSDVVAVRGYLDPFWLYYFNFGRPRGVWYGLPTVDSPANDTQPGDPFYLPGIDADAANMTLFESAPAKYRQLWFVTDLNMPVGTEGMNVEGWLREHYRMGNQWEFIGSGRVRVVLFSLR